MIKTFGYENARGWQSNRVVYVTGNPSKFVSGTDLSELSIEEQALYAVEAGKLHDAYMLSIANLNDEYDLVKRYRQFDPAKMTATQTETI